MKMTSTFTVTLTLDLDNPLLGSAHHLVTADHLYPFISKSPYLCRTYIPETKFRVVFVVTLTFDLHM